MLHSVQVCSHSNVWVGIISIRTSTECCSTWDVAVQFISNLEEFWSCLNLDTLWPWQCLGLNWCGRDYNPASSSWCVCALEFDKATVWYLKLWLGNTVPWEKQVGVLVPEDSSGRQPGLHQAEYDFLQGGQLIWNTVKRKWEKSRPLFHLHSEPPHESTCWPSPRRAAKHGRCCVLSPSCLAASDSRYWCVVRFLPFQLSLSACEEK